MKKSFVIALAVLLIAATSIFAFADSAIKIFVDGKELDATVLTRY
jgi:fumarate reductase subunit C